MNNSPEFNGCKQTFVSVELRCHKITIQTGEQTCVRGSTNEIRISVTVCDTYRGATRLLVFACDEEGGD